MCGVVSVGVDVRTNPMPTPTRRWIAVSDNVLTVEDWPLDEVTFNDEGVVSEQRNCFEGVYTLPDMRGWTLSDVETWADHDPTGSHPEIYYEVYKASE